MCRLVELALIIELEAPMDVIIERLRPIVYQLINDGKIEERKDKDDMRPYQDPNIPYQLAR